METVYIDLNWLPISDYDSSDLDPPSLEITTFLKFDIFRLNLNSAISKTS